VRRKNIRLVATILAVIGLVGAILNAISTHQVFFQGLILVLVGVVVLNVLRSLCSFGQTYPLSERKR